MKVFKGNIKKIFKKLQKTIKKEYGDFLGLDVDLRPVYSKQKTP